MRYKEIGNTKKIDEVESQAKPTNITTDGLCCYPICLIFEFVVPSVNMVKLPTKKCKPGLLMSLLPSFIVAQSVVGSGKRINLSVHNLFDLCVIRHFSSMEGGSFDKFHGHQGILGVRLKKTKILPCFCSRCHTE